MSDFISLAADLAPGRTRTILISYLLNMSRGSGDVRDMILSDIHRFSDLGAASYATRLGEVLDCFDASLRRRRETKASI